MFAYTSIAVFLFSAISLIVPSGFSVGAGMLSLGAVVLLKKKNTLQLDREDCLIVALLLLYFAVAVTMNLLHQEIFREYDLPLRFLLGVPALLLLRKYPPSPAMFWSGLAVGGIAAGFYAGWQNLFVLHGRAGGHTNAIQYGNIAFILGTLCLAGLGWAKAQTRANVWLMLLIAGAALGMLGSMFTGSRGSWAALPVCLIILYRCFGGSFSRRFVFGGLGALALAVVVMFAIPRTEVRERTELAFTEAYSYLKTRNADSSIGTRMEMWRTGYLAASERPLLGWGKAGFVERETEMIKAKMVSPIMQDNNHVYNEWLDAIVKRGLPGLLVLLALYIVPLVLFRRYLRQGNAASMPYALAGTLLIVNYIGFGFSQVFLAHNTGVMTLVFMLVIIWSLLRAAAPLQSLRQ